MLSQSLQSHYEASVHLQSCPALNLKYTIAFACGNLWLNSRSQQENGPCIPPQASQCQNRMCHVQNTANPPRDCPIPDKSWRSSRETSSLGNGDQFLWRKWQVNLWNYIPRSSCTSSFSIPKCLRYFPGMVTICGILLLSGGTKVISFSCSESENAELHWQLEPMLAILDLAWIRSIRAIKFPYSMCLGIYYLIQGCKYHRPIVRHPNLVVW